MGIKLAQESNVHECGQPQVQAITRTRLLRNLDVPDTWSRRVGVLDAFCMQARFAETPVVVLDAIKAVKLREAERPLPKQDDA
jgi:hypothetical protein